jgi:hypothetical protein
MMPLLSISVNPQEERRAIETHGPTLLASDVCSGRDAANTDDSCLYSCI